MEKSILDYNGSCVRVVDNNGEMVWAAKDVCQILGIVDHQQAVQDFDDIESVQMEFPTESGIKAMIGLREPGLYRLIFQSRRPEALAFKKWVWCEVLPSIRKTGAYSVYGNGVVDDVDFFTISEWEVFRLTKSCRAHELLTKAALDRRDRLMGLHQPVASSFTSRTEVRLAPERYPEVEALFWVEFFKLLRTGLMKEVGKRKGMMRLMGDRFYFLPEVTRGLGLGVSRFDLRQALRAQSYWIRDAELKQRMVAGGVAERVWGIELELFPKAEELLELIETDVSERGDIETNRRN